MNIDINSLTEAELIDLNNRIVERLKFLNQARAHVRMLDFKIGDRVCFRPEGRPAVIGMLTRYNKKTVTVITDTGGALEYLTQFLAAGGGATEQGSPRPKRHSHAQEVRGRRFPTSRLAHAVRPPLVVLKPSRRRADVAAPPSVARRCRAGG